MNTENKHKPVGSELGFFSLAARRKYSAPSNFAFYKLSRVENGTIVTGATYSGLYTRGKKKDRPKFDGTNVQVFVSDDDYDLEQKNYAAETGKCPSCWGCGKTVKMWDIVAGTVHVTCWTCGGNGLANENGLNYIK